MKNEKWKMTNGKSVYSSFEWGGARSRARLRLQLGGGVASSNYFQADGKAKPFRTSGGKAAGNVILKSSLQTMKRAADIVARGGVIAFRTDTFYGLGVNPFDVPAVRRIKELKGREGSKPILLVISDRNQVERFIEKPSKDFRRLAERFWPGPLTLIGPAHAEVPEEIAAGTRTVGIRLPDDEGVRNLVRACGGALTATSANPSDRPAAKSAQEVIDYFPSGIDLIIDGGTSQSDQPSSVVDASGDGFRLVREGAISRDELMSSYAD